MVVNLKESKRNGTCYDKREKREKSDVAVIIYNGIRV